MGTAITRRQATVLRSLRYQSRTAQWMCVRSDVLWRLEERGLVSRNSHTVPRWSITNKGIEVIDALDALESA